MRQQNPWLTVEIRTLEEEFKRNPNVAIGDLQRLLPRHSAKSITQKFMQMKLTRLPGTRRQRPGWAAIAKLLERRSMTRQEIADELGCTRANVQMIMGTVKGQWHIGTWRNSGHYAVMTPVIALGPGQDAPYPKKGKTPKTGNPFAIASGSVKPIDLIAPARRFAQSMDVKDDELEAA
jgi:hypothetical protein